MLNFRIGFPSSIGAADCRTPVGRPHFRFFDNRGSASSKPTTEFAQPRLSRGPRAAVPSEGVQIWVCLFLYGQSLLGHPHDRPKRNKHTQICTPSLGMTAL